MIDIKKCKYKIVVDTREKVCGHIIKGFDVLNFTNEAYEVMYKGLYNLPTVGA